MKNILFVASDNNIISGAFRSMVKLCELINKSGKYKVIVVVPSRGEGISLLESANIEYRFIPSYSWIVKMPYKRSIKNITYKLIKKIINNVAVRQIVSLIKKENIIIVHSNTSYTYVGQKAALKTRKKSVWHIRELLEEDQKCCFWEENCINLLKKADCCVAISNCVKEKYSSKLNNINVVYNGIEPSIYYNNRNFLRCKKTVDFLCIGNMSGGKGQDVVLLACRHLREIGISNFKVRFVGSGIKEIEYKKQSEQYGLGEYVEFCGVTDKAFEYYRNSDVLIMSSDAEAFGRTTVEAMMSGCLIIGSNSGATPELLSPNVYGLLFKKGDAMSLFECMKEAIENDTIYDLAEKGQKYAMENFTAEINANNIIKLYDDLIERM